MSGGHFDYREHVLTDIADSIEHVVINNDNDKKDEFGYPIGYHYSDDVISKLNTAVKLMRLAYAYAHRVDYLISGDCGEKSFLTRLEEDLNRLKNQG